MENRARAAGVGQDVSQDLATLRLHAQKKRYRYREQDPEKRLAFSQALAQLSPENCVYIDEAGAENTLDYPYAYSPKGISVYAERLGHATKRVSMIAAWCLGKVFAPMTFTGHCDSRVVETWFAKVLVPELRPGQTVILDNASFHRQAKLTALLEPLGCTLLPLPPYSPDLNKIEHLWHRIKSFVRHDHTLDRDFHQKVNAAFCSL